MNSELTNTTFTKKINDFVNSLATDECRVSVRSDGVETLITWEEEVHPPIKQHRTPFEKDTKSWKKNTIVLT